MSWKQYCREENWHDAAKLFPMLPEEELSELADDIGKHGLQNPIVLFDDKVLDGRNRLLACRLAEVEPQFHQWEANGSSPVAWVISLNLKRRHLTATQKAVVAFEALPLFEAEAKDRQKLSEGRGRKKEAEKGTQKVAEVFGEAREQAAKSTGANRQYVADVKRIADKTPELVEKMKSGELSITDALVEAGFKQAVTAMTSSESDEWYTPKEYIAAARKVIGEIDLDPASCKEANKVVKAEKIFTIEDDGLSKPWKGRIWLNPPYGKSGPKFVAKLVQEFEHGSVSEALLLVNSHCTDAKWFRPLGNYLLCFTNHRTQFWTPDKEEVGGSTHGSVIVYFGKNESTFFEHFSEFGMVLHKWCGVKK